MKLLSKKQSLIALCLAGIALFSLNANAQLNRPTATQAKQPAELDRCSRFDSANGERHYWIQTQTDVSQLFANQASHAGYNPGGGYSWSVSNIPSGFVDQQESLYCSSFIDPAGFAHHISQNRSCSLHLSTQHAGGGNQTVVATLKHSGCYLKSSTRKANRPIPRKATQYSVE